MRSLVDIVTQDQFIPGSEYLETLLVAVPKYAVPIHPRGLADSCQQKSGQRLEPKV